MKFLNRLMIGLMVLVGFAGIVQATSWTKTDQITSSSGGAVDFPSGFTTGEGSLWQAGSATVTPTVGTNVTFVSQAAVKFMSIGNSVIGYGQTSVAKTTGAATSIIYIPVPVSRSAVFTNATTSGGTGTCGNYSVVTGAGVVVASGGASTMMCTFTATGTTPEKINFQFDYVLTGD